MLKKDEKIQDEIRKRVLEEHNRRLEAEEVKLQSEANVDALHDITGISKAEIQRIADEVRVEMQGVPLKLDNLIGWLKKHKKYILCSLAFMFMLLMFSNAPFVQRMTSATRFIIPQQFQNNTLQDGSGAKEYFPFNNQFGQKRLRRHRWGSER